MCLAKVRVARSRHPIVGPGRRIDSLRPSNTIRRVARVDRWILQILSCACRARQVEGVAMIPVNIITGALGVGKTTTIRHLLSQRPPDERWAIVVNEFGALGIDGAVIDTAGGIVAGADGTTTTGGGDGGVVVREVAGGCLCCAVAAPFTVAVTQVLRRAKPDRLLIEPSGMGHPGGLFDALSGEHFRGVLDLRATVALVDMTEVSSRGDVFHSEAFRDQVHCADAVVGAKADLASPEHETQFRRWAETLYPPKSLVSVVAHGRLPLDTLDIACGPTVSRLESSHVHAATENASTSTPGSVPGTAGTARIGLGPLGAAPKPVAAGPGVPARVLGGSDEFKTAGWVFHRDDIFVRPRLTALFEALRAEPAVKRCKGVLRVGKEWVVPAEKADGSFTFEPVAHRRDSRLEIIVAASEEARDANFVEPAAENAGKAAAALDWDAVERAVLAALKPQRPAK